MKSESDMAVKLPPQVERTIAELLPSDDPLDRDEFDVIDFINRNFPDESALPDIDNFIHKLKQRVKQMEADLSQTVQEQAKAGTQAVEDLKSAQQAIQFLCTKIQQIRTKADHSEVMVQEICRDIKQLDYAKRHLQTTIATLKQLHMLVQGVDQVETMAAQRMYVEASGLYSAVMSLFKQFEKYLHIPKIKQLRQKMDSVRDDLANQVFGDFEAVGNLAELSEETEGQDKYAHMLKSLKDACLVIDAIGGAPREKLIESFCKEQLQPYNKLFGKEGPEFDLDKAERRYPWFSRMLRNVLPKMDVVFPPQWQVPRRLAISFCECTRSHFLTYLGQQAAEEIHVTALLKALQRTLRFEKDLADRYEENKSTEEPSEELSADDVREKYALKGIKNQNVHSDQEAFVKFHGIISGCFDPYMISYVALERKKLEEMMDQVMQTERLDRDGPLPVFSSSVNIFVYIREAIKRCTALSKGQAFFDLHSEFKACLRGYASRLTQRLQMKGTSYLTEKSSSRSLTDESSEAQSSLREEVEVICFVINTCEYCAETLPSLADMISAKIDEAYQENVELDDEIDVFHDCAAAGMKTLVARLESKLEGELQQIPKQAWATWENVGDQSDCIFRMGQQIESFVPLVHEMLPDLYFNNFCDKFAASFLGGFLQTIFKCKKVNEMGVQQLLLDTYALKTIFLQLPTMGSEDKAPAIPPRYTKLVTSEIAQTETVLKLVGTPTEKLVSSFKIMWPDGTAEDFQQVMSVKGLRKSEQQALLEEIGLEKSAGASSFEESSKKMSDTITENFKKNMQHLKNKSRFGFN